MAVVEIALIAKQAGTFTAVGGLGSLILEQSTAEAPLPQTIGGWGVLSIAIAVSGYLARRWARDSDATDSNLTQIRLDLAAMTKDWAEANAGKAVAEAINTEVMTRMSAQGREIESLRTAVSEKKSIERELRKAHVEISLLKSQKDSAD
jgi:hypothetical protein